MHISEFIAPLTPANKAVARSGRTFQTASKRFLIMRLGSHGDILMGTPLISALRAEFPEAWITWIVESSEKECIDANPYIDEVLVWHSQDFKVRRSLLHKIRRYGNLRWLQQELLSRRYDVFISFQAEEWLPITKLVQADVKIGFFDYFNVITIKERIRGEAEGLFTHVIGKDDHPAHRTDQFLSVLTFLNLDRPKDLSMNMGFTQQDDEAQSRFLRLHGIGLDEGFAIVAPMSTWVTRNWPASRYAEISDRIASELNLPIVLIGSKREHEAVTAIADLMKTKPILAAGVFRFREMAALIANARLLVGGDSGPMHVAGAVGTPYVAIFGSTPVNGRKPLVGVGQAISFAVPCGPCDWHQCSNANTPLICLESIEVTEVLNAAKSLVDGRCAHSRPLAASLRMHDSNLDLLAQ